MVSNLNISSKEARKISTSTTPSNLVINKFPNREVYEKIKEKGSLGADDVNVLEDYPGLEWKGEYSSTATYVKGDIVYYENMLYVMVSASVIGAIPGIDNDWIDFAKRSVTSSDVTNALGFTPADSTKVLPLSGGTLTGNLTGKCIIGTWLQATDAGHLATTPTKIPVFDDKGWIYYRTPAEILKDIGASSGYTLTEADKTEIAGKVVADGTEFTLSDFPTALKNPKALTFTGAATGTYDGSEALTITIPEGGSGGSTGGGLRKMSAVSGYIGIPVAELPQDGTVWMCISKGDGAELYSGTVTIEGGSLTANNLIAVSSGSVIQLNQATTIGVGFVIYGMSATDYVGVWQQVGAGSAAINWRGEYSAQTAYNRLDAVSYEGSSYVFASDTPAIGAIPGVDGEWQLMAQKGDSGTNLSLGVTGATVGQIAKITAVDASGKPTAWAPVDMPSGGRSPSMSSDWTLLADITLSEDSAVIKIDKTAAGDSFSIRELAFFGEVKCDTINKELTLWLNGQIGYGHPVVYLGKVLNAAEAGTEYLAVYVEMLPECVFSRTQHCQYNSGVGYNPPSFSASNLRDKSQIAYAPIGNPLTVFAIAPWESGKSGVFKAGTSLKFYGRR